MCNVPCGGGLQMRCARNRARLWGTIALAVGRAVAEVAPARNELGGVRELSDALGGDDDCELSGTLHGANLLVTDWPRLRALLSNASLLSARSTSSIAEDTHVCGDACQSAALQHELPPIDAPRADEMQRLLSAVRGRRSEAKLQCPVGWAAACLAGISETELLGVGDCLEGIRLLRALASRWPILAQLRDLQHRRQKFPRASGVEAQGDCDGVFHPSLDWIDFLAHAKAFAEVVPPWLAGLHATDGVPEEFSQAVAHAGGVVWKASSAAVWQGRAISDWSADCPLGVLAANIIRASSIVLGDSDAYRIVQRSIENMEKVFSIKQMVLSSPWPIFGLLHCLSLMKKHFHDLQLPPADFLPVRSEAAEVDVDQERSELWHAAATVLRRAGRSTVSSGSATGFAMMTALPHWRVNYLHPLLKRVWQLGVLEALVVAPLMPNVTETCESITELFLTVRQPDVAPEWSPCLPYISQFGAKVQFVFVFLAIQLGVAVLWFDLHVFWVQSPLPWIREAVNHPLPPPSYKSLCDASCPEAAMPDIYTVDDFYSPLRAKSSLFLLLPSLAARKWVMTLLHWLCTYPFGKLTSGFQYLLRPDAPDMVPSVSMLPAAQDVPKLTRAELDAESFFVSTDGWHGRLKRVLAYELQPYLAEPDRVMLLDRLFEGSQEDVLRLVQSSRKAVSPLRPTQTLHLLSHDDAAEGNGRAGCFWQRYDGAYIGGYAADIDDSFDSLNSAQCTCIQLGHRCAGVTCESMEHVDKSVEAGGLQCTVRRGVPLLAQSPIGEDSHVKRCEGHLALGCDAPPVELVVHVNFADGCCEAEQRQSSDTAVHFGADESRPLRGDFLDPDFRERNHALLTFNRTPELTQHKTPTGKIGYYVWKPYVILRTVEDPSLPWDTTVIAWTDAGIHFVSDMKPLVDKYMNTTDVSATRTPMLEGDFSKRDAFLLLDADYQSIIETNQVATGFILVRKTHLAVDFLRAWLRACEDPRIMTELPSELGAPDYFSFINNNDDQTAFSLLFKKYGFRPFSVGERDAVVYTGRNLAKFIKASDDFALGRKSDRDAYLQAADEAAAEKSGAR